MHGWKFICDPKTVRMKCAPREPPVRGGAWLRLDPTPSTALTNPNRGSNTIESARTLWQDYVLGLDQEKQPKDIFGASSARVLGLFDLSAWNRTFQGATDTACRATCVASWICRGDFGCGIGRVDHGLAGRPQEFGQQTSLEKKAWRIATTVGWRVVVYFTRARQMADG